MMIKDINLIVSDWMSPFDRVVCGEYNGTYNFILFR